MTTLQAGLIGVKLSTRGIGINYIIFLSFESSVWFCPPPPPHLPSLGTCSKGAAHWPPSSAKVKNELSYTSATTPYVFMACTLTALPLSSTKCVSRYSYWFIKVSVIKKTSKFPAGKAVLVHVMKAYRQSRGMAPLSLNLRTRRRWLVKFMPQLLYKLQCPLTTRLGGPHSWSGLLEIRWTLQVTWTSEEKKYCWEGMKVWIVQPTVYSLNQLSYPAQYHPHTRPLPISLLLILHFTKVPAILNAIQILPHTNNRG
jgi:hypothetical protein